jgi:hypothetical protein
MDETALLKIERTELAFPQIELSQLPAKLSKKLWVEPVEFLEVTHAPVLAQWAVRIRAWWRPVLPAPAARRRGPKMVYPAWSILLIAVIQVAWQMSYEEVIDYWRAHPAARQMVGLPAGRMISVGQYWERRRALGSLPFWFFFVAMAAQLLRLGIIQGTDVIVDSTTQKVWFHHDAEAAWSYPKPWKGSTWGYKVHTLLCRWSQLPLMFLVTPANRHDSLLAIPLLTLAVVCYGLTITIVRADAAYFTLAILGFIRTVLGASALIDYNLRRKGKRFLATLFFIEQWRLHLRPRAIIERHFGWAKRYFGLESARWSGLVAAYQHTALVYSVMLGVALVAYRYQRPELAGSRTSTQRLK